MKYLKLFIASFTVFLGLGLASLPALATAASLPTAVVSNEAADPSSGAQSTVCQTLGSDATCSTDPSGGVSVNQVLKVVLDVLSIVIGIAAVIMIIIGGFRYITSGGDSNSVSGAKNTILYALIGLAIVAVAQGLVEFVLNKIAG